MSKVEDPTSADSESVRKLVRAHGEARAAAHLRCDRFTLVRIVARFGVREGTLAVVRERFVVPVEASAQGSLFGATPAPETKVA